MVIIRHIFQGWGYIPKYGKHSHAKMKISNKMGGKSKKNRGLVVDAFRDIYKYGKGGCAKWKMAIKGGKSEGMVSSSVLRVYHTCGIPIDIG